MAQKDAPPLTVLRAMLRESGKQQHSGAHKMENLQYPLTKIINVAHELKNTGRTGASTGEQIAAAFVLNNMDYLPAGYTDVNDAWDRLDTWQVHVKRIKRDYMHLIHG
jgi:hypothetical protein